MRSSRRDASRSAATDASRVDAGAAPAATARGCEWCGDPLPCVRRRDSRTCKQSCRQALHRFRIAPAAATAETPLALAYFDPPYPGLARKYYQCDEVDHAALVERACRDYPDGWALSTSGAALPSVLRVCPRDVRVAIWVRGARHGQSKRPRSAYEALIVRGGRELDDVAGHVTDVLVEGATAKARSHPDAVVGMKPAAFCEWLFHQLGALRGDTLHDAYRGSGVVTRAWGLYQAVKARSALPSRYVEAARAVFA